MAFPKKGLRKITVNGENYAYRIKGDDYGISFSIGLLEKKGTLLTGRFGYQYNRVSNFDLKNGGQARSWTLYRRIIITPDTIRQVIDYALKNGWQAHKPKGQFRLKNIDNQLQIKLKPATTFPKLENNQVAMVLAKEETKYLLLDKTPYAGEGNIYQVFEDIATAKVSGRKIVTNDPDIVCWLLISKNKAIYYISNLFEKAF